MRTQLAITRHPMLRILRSPRDVQQLSVSEWEDILWVARQTRLGGHLWHILDTQSLLDHLPPAAQRRLSSAFLAGEHQRQQIMWEADRVHWALGREAPSFILLKGAAYAAANLDIAIGRDARDLDILVPPHSLSAVENALLNHGWQHVVTDDYDQGYYRLWMHELPPLRHLDRATEVDIHHAIVPRSSRASVDMAPFREVAITVDNRGTRVLAPVDMTLHCAVHLFQTGEIRGELRDLVDFKALLDEFSSKPDFWSELVPRAMMFGLQRPLFYALRYVSQILGSEIPGSAMRQCESARPTSILLMLMDFMVPRALIPPRSRTDVLMARVSGLCLYVRAHWLRMAPKRLVVHLTRKLLRHWKLREREV
jgi:Uncharacterised nucleotidyltransferase